MEMYFIKEIVFIQINMIWEGKRKNNAIKLRMYFVGNCPDTNFRKILIMVETK